MQSCCRFTLSLYSDPTTFTEKNRRLREKVCLNFEKCGTCFYLRLQ